jgi:hypothetical protein
VSIGDASIFRSELLLNHNRLTGGSFVTKKLVFVVAILTLGASIAPLSAEEIRGRVIDQSGQPMEGVMISATDEDHRRTTSVFSQADGSFAIDGLRDVAHNMRARRMGHQDEWLDDVEAGGSDVLVKMLLASGLDLEDQRPANSAFSMLKFDNKRDKLNFKMMCTYCHQIGTIGFRTPEKPVDWETMLRRMDGFGGLYRHTQRTIVKRLVDTYKDDAINK